jgi:hypothetical protein
MVVLEQLLLDVAAGVIFVLDPNTFSIQRAPRLA